MVWWGILRAFDSGTYKATVEVAGSRGFNLVGVLVSRGIAAGEMVAGRTVIMAVHDATTPDGAMVVGVR